MYCRINGYTMTHTDAFPSALADLDSHRSQLVCLYLSVRGGATMADLKRDLNVPYLTLYGILPDLREAGLVVQEGDRLWYRSAPAVAAD